jgi:hypothetical protein
LISLEDAVRENRLKFAYLNIPIRAGEFAGRNLRNGHSSILDQGRDSFNLEWFFNFTDLELKEEPWADSFLAFDIDHSLKELADLFADVEPQADALFIDSLLALKLAKKLEEFRFVLFTDSFALVLDIDH